MLGHGATPRSGFFDDYNVDNAKKKLYAYELKGALESFSENIGRRIDLVMMNSCDMQNIEHTYELKNAIKYYVGSQKTMIATHGENKMLYIKDYS